MANNEKMVTCRTPTPGKKPASIPVWKYDLVHSAILPVVPANGDGVELRMLAGLVRKRLLKKELESLGSVSWYTTTVKLDMDLRGELERIPDSKPQRLRRVADKKDR